MNRQERRQSQKTERFMSNKKGTRYSIFETARYKKVIQCVDGKKIEHYVLIKKSKFCFCKKPKIILEECSKCNKPLKKLK